jgi:alpha-tubulin suppressor-like RCC1 family protein
VKFTAIAPGIENTCGISKFRHVYCWGDGGSGVLGQGDLLGPNQCVDRPCSFAPLEVKAKAGLQFASVAVGGYSTACALTVNGEVWCWGDDQYDTFGDGLPQHANVSLPVPLAVGYGPFVHLSIGAFAVCGSTDGHRINCWGGNSSAVLGLGPFKAPESCTTSSTFDCSSRPLPIYATWKAATSPKSLSFENQTACALTPRGEAWCWGSGDHGQLGNGTASAAQATPVQVADAPLFHQIAVSNGSACAITLGGTICCWGQIVSSNKPIKLPL